MSIPFLPIHPHPNGLMSKTNRRRLRRQQAGATASQGGPDFMSPEDQFRMSLDRGWRDVAELQMGSALTDKLKTQFPQDADHLRGLENRCRAHVQAGTTICCRLPGVNYVGG